MATNSLSISFIDAHRGRPMRYFTREWYDSVQNASRLMAREKRWKDKLADPLYNTARTNYSKYLDTIKSEIAPDVMALIGLHLHDAKVIESELSDRILSIVVEDMYAQGRYNRQMKIHFFEVDAVEGIDGFIGQDIDYDEIFVNPNGTYVYSALSHKTEFSICFRSVTLSSVAGGRKTGDR